MQLQWEFCSVRSSHSVPGDDSAQRSYKEQNLYLLLKRFVLCSVALDSDPLLLKAVLSYSPRRHNARFTAAENLSYGI